MITPTKTYSSNPFVDNVIYYGKLMAMNCTIKDEEEALANETKESLYAADVLFACVENRATYEMFEKIPQEILEKYIPVKSNLDSYVQNIDTLRVKLNSLSLPEKNRTISKLSSLARAIYIDHYDTMTNYILNDAGTDWIVQKRSLYDKCKNEEATYNDLFDELPLRTNLRIIKEYLDYYGYLDLAVLWDPDSKITKADVATIKSLSVDQSINTKYTSQMIDLLSDMDNILITPGYSSNDSIYLNQFRTYISMRSDSNIDDELLLISVAMRNVFISHYEIMAERKYFSEKISESSAEGNNAASQDPSYPLWLSFFFDRDTYELCKKGKATWENLYNLFPQYALKDALDNVLGADIVEEYGLLRDSNVLTIYFTDYCNDPANKKILLNEYMTNVYMTNYKSCLYLNSSVYFSCKDDNIDIFELYEYLPSETLKFIISSELPEVTNIQSYAESKDLLNFYFSTIPSDQATEIKNNITKDMIEWYPENHIETNNYYRSLIGLPPIDKDGNVYEDTLIHTWDPVTKSFIEFGDRYISQVPTSIYPEQHWKNELYKFDSYDISTLTSNEYNVIEDYVAGCGSTLSSPRYRYLKYLGDDKLNLYECRKAMNFDLIGLPAVDDTDIRNKFIDAYMTNQDYIVRSIYSDAYTFQSDYYNKFIIIFILVNTIMDIVSGIPDYIINRDVFDSRCIRYLFESFGIPYYSEIPKKYQQAMLKNLNTLIKYKSSTKNMIDICSLFGFSDAKVFGYYLMKDHEVDASTGEFIFNDNNQINYDLDSVYVLDPSADISEDGVMKDISGKTFIQLTKYKYYDENYYLKEIKVEDDNGNIVSKKIINSDANGIYIYDSSLEQMVEYKAAHYFSKTKSNLAPSSLKFIKVPIDGSVTNYKNDDRYIIPYDEVIQEETWDGGLDHDYLKNKILDYEFNIVKSKYISIETITNLTEMAFQMSYFYSMLFDNLYSEDLLTLDIPSIKQNHKFRFTDIICFLFAMTYYYSGLEDNIMYSPTQILHVKGYNFSDAVNAIFNNSNFYNQSDEYGVDLKDNQKENIFDINEQVQNGYDYRIASSIPDDFPNVTNEGYSLTFDSPEYYIKGFNLEADIEALDKWLNKECQMSLDDLVVSMDEEEFGQRITLKQFYSLNNPYYQKSIFNGNVTPSQYNNIIKYAYEFYLLSIIYINDITHTPHKYIKESSDNYIQIIYPIDNAIYVLNDKLYASNSTSNAIALYNKYVKSGNDYICIDKRYYTTNALNTYEPLIDGSIYIKNIYGYVYGLTDAYTIQNGEYVLINKNTNNSYIHMDNGYYVLNYGDYYIEQDGNRILNPDNCYVSATINDEDGFILLKSIQNYARLITDSDCYIKDSDGHFVRFDYTDYYIRTHNDSEMSNEMKYDELTLYIISQNETEYYDETMNPRVYYYEKISDYISNNDFSINGNELYVKDIDGNFIEESNIINPNNCWYISKSYYNDNGELVNEYKLIKDVLYSYNLYDNGINSSSILVLQNDYNYYKYNLNIVYSNQPIATSNEFNSDNDFYIIDNKMHINHSISDNLYITDRDTGIEYDLNNDLYMYELNTDNVYDLNTIATSNEFNSDNDFYIIDNKMHINHSISDNLYITDRDTGIEYDLNNDLYMYELNTDNVYDLNTNASYTNFSNIQNALNADYSYTFDNDTSKKYSLNSDPSYVTVLITNKSYDNTNKVIVIFNRDILIDNQSLSIRENHEYNPSLDDKVWDENDWFYGEAENSIGITGEDMWYYNNQDAESSSSDTNNDKLESIGSGWYLTTDQYIGSTQLVQGQEYYLSMDIECNFNGSIQIYNTADNNVSTNIDRTYTVKTNEKQHITQVFKANGNQSPEIRFIKYNFDNNPMHIGDYMIISNIRFSCGYNEHYIPTDIPSMNDLKNIYKVNSAIYKYLITQMRNTSDKRMYDVYKKLYDSLMVCKYNKEVFKISDSTYAKTYTEFLEYRDEILYDKLKYIKSLNSEDMKKEIADIIIEITYVLNDLINDDRLQYIYSYFPAVGASFVQQYIYKIINWFKSWKVHLLGINTIYRFGNSLIIDNEGNIVIDIAGDDFFIKILYDRDFRTNIYQHLKDAFVAGTTSLSVSTNMNNKVGIKDRIKLITRTANAITFTKDPDNMHIKLMDDTSTIDIQDGNILVLKTINGDEFRTINQNQLSMTTGYEYDKLFVSQLIDEINLLSGDYIDYNELEDDEEDE